VVEGVQAGGDDAAFGCVDVVDLDADVVERPTLGEVLRRVGDVSAGIERDVVLLRSDMDRAAAVARRALPITCQSNSTSISLAARSGFETVTLTCSMRGAGMRAISFDLVTVRPKVNFRSSIGWRSSCPNLRVSLPLI